MIIGWVAEWLKAPVLKTGKGETPSWVRIPPHPPYDITFGEFFYNSSSFKECVREFIYKKLLKKIGFVLRNEQF